MRELAMRMWVWAGMLVSGATWGAALAQGVPAERFPKPLRPVASIISDQWATEDTRERVGEAARVLQLMDIKPGAAVADIGAGSGYYVARLSKQVGAAGRVYGEDIVPEYLARLQRRVTAERMGNVTVVRGEAHDPKLPLGSVDRAVLVHMYHEIDQPFGLLSNLVPALRPGATVGILDANRATLQHGTPPALLTCELRAVGYRQVGFYPMEEGTTYLAVFTAPERAVAPESVVPCKP